ncbi:threonine/serine exporter family protein [Kytococcus sp. Marseille-QA3725]
MPQSRTPRSLASVARGARTGETPRTAAVPTGQSAPQPSTARATTDPVPTQQVSAPASSLATGITEEVVLAPGVQDQLAPGTVQGTTRRRVIRLADVVRPTSRPAAPLVQSGERGLDERRGRQVIDLALRTGEALLAAGTPAADVVATLFQLTSAFGVHSAHVDITFTSITVSIHRGIGEDPLSVMRVVRARTYDFTVVERLQAFVEELVENPEEIDTAASRLEEILHSPRPYRPWVATTALAMMGAAISALLGADWVTWILTFCTVLAIDKVLTVLGRWALPPFFAQIVAATIPALVAVGIYLVELHQPYLWGVPLDPPGNQVHSLVVASGIIVLLAGLGVVSTAQDALDGYYVTAGARAFEVAVMTTGVALGVALVLSAAHRAGLQLTFLNRPYLSDDLLTLVVSSSVFCFFSTIATYGSMRAAWVAAGLGSTAMLVYWPLSALGFSYEMRVTAAVASVSFLAHHLGRWLNVPSLALNTAVIAPFLPGGMVYRGIYQLMDNDPATYLSGVQQILSAVASGLALAAGVSLGTWVARTSTGFSRWQRKASRVVET